MNRFNSFFAIALVCSLSADAQGVMMNWSPVGNPGNANDGTGFGAVGYNFNIGTYDVTNNQYVEFLNAKDPDGTSPLQLYNSHMSSAPFGGISFNNLNPAGSMYGVISGDGNHPVNYETWYSAIRFANWLNNGQGSGDTETGAYTLLHNGSPTPRLIPTNGNSITRNVGATVFLPSENEWYKAAYNNPGGSTYNLYPTSSSLVPTASSPTATPNSANYNNAVGNLTDVGVYTGTTSPYGAFDMGGNVFQWDEALPSDISRGLRGGSFDSLSSKLQSSTGSLTAPTTEHSNIGFRVVNIPGGFVVPEPSTLALAAFGFMALAWRWRRRA